MNRIITFTTDFGTRDIFVGVMKGVILGIHPHATLVDITHDIAPQNILQGAFLLANAIKYFPANAVHVVVVDPGVGSPRRAIAVQTGETFFVAPDNGVLTLAIQRSEIRAIQLTKPQYWLPHVSNTFHGRDIFAPVAAHLSLGVPLDALGEPINDLVQLSQCNAAWRAGNEIAGYVAHIDHFGNVITNIDEKLLAGIDRARATITLHGKTLTGIKATYAAVAQGELLALVSSGGTLEIAMRNGNAAQTLGAQLGDQVIVSNSAA